MSEKKNKFVVGSLEQAALFELELKGQLSDGHWEGFEPWDHWRVWCDSEVVVSDDGAEQGRHFYAMEDCYDFADPDLVGIVGNRMKSIVKLARKFGLETAQKMESLLLDLNGDYRGIPDFARECAQKNPDGYYGRLLDTAQSWDFVEVHQTVAADTYSDDELKRDLEELKRHAQTFIRPKR